jgi:hypothetical protein
MRVILLATGVNPEIQKFVPDQIPALLPLIDRSFIQHVVEMLAAQGAREYEVILSEHPERFEALLGDGARWGVHITYHLARDPEHPWSALKAVRPPDDPDEWIVLADAETLPLFDFRSPPTVPEVFFAESAAPAWMGWGRVPWTLLAGMPADIDPAALMAAGAVRQTVPECLSVKTYEELLRSSQVFFAHRFPGLLCHGIEVEPGIWLSRNVQIRPGAHIRPPVYLGDDCRIGSGVTLGPGVVIGHGCVLDNGSSVQASIVLPGSYVGGELEICDALVDRNCLVNVRVGAVVQVSDNFILGNLSNQVSGSWWQSLLARALAGLLLLLALPLSLLYWGSLRSCGHPVSWRQRRIACLPVPEEAYRLVQVPLWEIGELPPRRLYLTDFLLRVVPGLVRVLLGGVHLTGIDPVTPAELEAMSPARRNLCRKAKAGLISESLIISGAMPSPDDRYAAESFYASLAGFETDLGLLATYAWRVVSGQRLERKTGQPPLAEKDGGEELEPAKKHEGQNDGGQA